MVWRPLSIASIRSLSRSPELHLGDAARAASPTEGGAGILGGDDSAREVCSVPDSPTMPAIPEDAIVELLGLRLTATLGTMNGDGTLLLTPIWYLYEGGRLYLPTGSGSHK